MANQLLGNMNSTIMLRTVDVDTQERLAKRLPEVPISYVMKTTATSLGDTTISGAYSLNHGERLMQEDKPIIAPQSFGDLSDLEYFAIFAKGNLIKGRLPILDAPDEGYHAARAEHFSVGASTFRYDHEGAAGDDLAEITRFGEALPPPPVLEVEVPHHQRPVPPDRRRFMPFVRWVEVLPGYRKTDRVPAPLPDDYLMRSALIEDAANSQVDAELISTS